MTKRLIQTITHGTREVKVYWCSEWQEYQCRLYQEGELDQPATYFTEDLDDAVGSAKYMVGTWGEKKESRA